MLEEALAYNAIGRNLAMKVCYVFSTSEITGGANRSMLDLLGALNRDIVEPIALIKKHGDIEESLGRIDIPVFLIPFINELSTGNFVLDTIKRLHAIKTTSQVERFLREQKVALVHNNSLPALAGMEAAKKLGIPYICHIREQVKEGLGLRLLNEKNHFNVVKNAACILAISQFICEEYKEVLSGCPITVLHDGFDTTLYLNEEKKIFGSDIVNIAIYGNLDSQKGQIEAVKAVELLRDKGYRNIALHIIGNQLTNYAKSVKRYIREKNLKEVKLYEAIKGLAELKKSRESMDINLICSKAEGLGRVTVESMLSGCLTIGANAGATPEIIQDNENGLLYECNNFKNLAQRIEWAMENRKACSEIAFKGRITAKEKYDINQYADAIQKLYQGIVKSSCNCN